MSYADLVAADRRLVILRILAESIGYTCNEHLIASLLESFGHVLSRDALRTELAWLEEQRLLTVQDVAGVTIAKLTARGADVAADRAWVPGVKRPVPDA